MKKIKAVSIVLFNLLVIAALLSTWGLSRILPADWFPPSQPLGVIEAIVLIVLFYTSLFSLHRMQLGLFPIPEGPIQYESWQRVNYDVYVLTYLLFFNPLIRSFTLPLPLMRPIYQALGAKLGPNTFPSGILYDPSLITIGSNAIIGDNSIFVPHILEAGQLAHKPIILGNNVTIGMRAIILSGTVIEDNAVVAAGSVMKKDTHIGAGEVWAGVPAKRIAPKVSDPAE